MSATVRSGNLQRLRLVGSCAVELTTMSGPHDSLFKETFSKPENAAVELRAVLPAELLTRLDLSTLRKEPGSFVAPELAQTHTDLLFTVELLGRPAYVYVLFEHQSTVDALMPLRLLEYQVRIWLEHVRARQAAKESAVPLPLIIPLVLHHSESGWTAATSFGGLFDEDLLAVAEIARLVPDFEFVLDDLSRASNEELLGRAKLQAEQVVTLVLWALRDARTTSRFMDTILGFSSFLEDLSTTTSGQDALRTVMYYLSELKGQLGLLEFRRIIEASSATQKAKEIVMSLAEQLIQEGEQQGLAKGRVEGLAKGRVEGRRSSLLQLADLKLGGLSEHSRQRIETASEDELLSWTTKLLSAEVENDIFGDG